MHFSNKIRNKAKKDKKVFVKFMFSLMDAKPYAENVKRVEVEHSQSRVNENKIDVV